MAILNPTQRNSISASYQQEKSSIREILPGITKIDLLNAVNALDNWFDDNSTAINLAIPQPVRGALSLQQKLDLVLKVLQKRVKGD